MGMFDEIRCDYPLPGGVPFTNSFQTKSLDCNLDRYWITAGGELLRRVWDWEPTGKWYTYMSGIGRTDVPCPEVPYTNEDFDWAWETLQKEGILQEEEALANDILNAPIQEMVKVNQRWEHHDFTGEINFYDYDNLTDKLYQFYAKFEDGYLQDIRKGG